MPYRISNTVSKPRISKRLVLFALLGLLLIVCLIAILEATNRTHFFHTEKDGNRPTASQNTKGEISDGDTKNTPEATSTPTPSTNTDSPQPGDTKSNSSTGQQTALLNPTGNFVSNHEPTLSSPKNSMTSVCTTTPGATCTITFTKDGIKKSLEAQTTDRGGSAYWNWKLQDKEVGLTAGNWKIEAVATLNGKTATSTDAIELMVTE